MNFEVIIGGSWLGMKFENTQEKHVVLYFCYDLILDSCSL